MAEGGGWRREVAGRWVGEEMGGEGVGDGDGRWWWVGVEVGGGGSGFIINDINKPATSHQSGIIQTSI